MMRAVVFDLDGTLLDSMPLVLRMYGHAISPFLDPLSDEQWRSHMGGPPQRILERVLRNPSHVSEALVRLAEYELLHLNTIVAFEGMKSLLEQLSRAGLQIGLWTGRDRRTAEALLDEHQIGGMLAVRVCGDDLTTHKPDPEGLSVVLQKLDASPTEAIFVGDSDVDVLSGAALGVKTLWITHGLPIEPALAAQAWHVVRTPSEAYAVIRTQLLDSKVRGKNG